jgi:alpha-galactosidase
MLGNDISKLSPEVYEILTNKEVIAVDQDKLGKQGVKVRDDGDFEVWSKQLSNGSRAVVLFNRSAKEIDIAFKWSEIGYPDYLEADVRDLWKKSSVGKLTGSYSAKVKSHGVVMIKVSPVKK